MLTKDQLQAKFNEAAKQVVDVLDNRSPENGLKLFIH